MSHDLPDDKSSQQIRRVGTRLVIGGWLLGIVLMTLMFNGFLDRQQNPNTRAKIEAQTVVPQGQTWELKLQANKQGMYWATGLLNGNEVNYVVDTGASYVSVPLELAVDAGLELGESIRLRTANGSTNGWKTEINELEIGPMQLRNVAAVAIMQHTGPVLLGMNALRGMRMTQSNGVLVLTPDR